jgi:hypothetical protein
MFLALARDDRAAEKPASAAGALLRVRLARLLLRDMESLKAQGERGAGPGRDKVWGLGVTRCGAWA